MGKDNGYYKQCMILALLVIVVIINNFTPTLPDLTLEARKILLLFVLALILWGTKPIPYFVSSFIILALLMILPPRFSFKESITGFSNQAIYFLLGISMIGNAVARVGLTGTLTKLLFRLFGSGVTKTIWGLCFCLIFMPFLIPSSVARVKTIYPILQNIMNRLDNSDQKIFMKIATMLLGNGAVIMSIVVMTGGGIPIIAATFINESFSPISWWQWFVLMAPISIITMVCFTLFISCVPFSDSAARTDQKTNNIHIESSSFPPKILQIIGLFIVLGMLTCWVIGPIFNISIIVPVFFGVFFFAIPPLSAIDQNDLTSFEWDIFILLGTALSLGNYLSDSGAALFISRHILRMAHFIGLSDLLTLVILVIMLRLIFVSFVACTGVIIPLLSLWAKLTTLDPLLSILTVAYIITIGTIVPIQSPPLLIMYEKGFFSNANQMSIGAFLIIFSVFIIYIHWYLYWPWILPIIGIASS